MIDHEHLGDDAALYALGALDDDARLAIDQRAAACERCARELAAAEADVTAMVEAASEESNVVPLRPRRRPVWRTALAAAVAAALVAGIVPTAYFWQRDAALRQSMETESAAMSRLASTPHRIVAFNAMPSGAQAQVMYGLDGAWYVVLVRGASRALSVVWMHDGERTMLGTAQPYGDVALLYLPASHRMDRLALMDGNQMVAEAQLAF